VESAGACDLLKTPKKPELCSLGFEVGAVVDEAWLVGWGETQILFSQIRSPLH
jgi:hypothetical protein